MNVAWDVASSSPAHNKMIEDKDRVDGEEVLVEQKCCVYTSGAQIRSRMHHAIASIWQKRCQRRDKIGQHVVILTLTDPKNTGSIAAIHLLDDFCKLVEFLLIEGGGPSVDIGAHVLGDPGDPMWVTLRSEQILNIPKSNQ